MSAAQQLLMDALQLPLDERANMAHQLLLSLESEPFEDDYEAAWEHEISERVKRMDNGDSDTMEWRQAHAEIRANRRRRTTAVPQCGGVFQISREQ